MTRRHGIDGRELVERTRKQIYRRDLLDLATLLAVDFLFIAWPAARLPFFTREESAGLLMLAHLIPLAWFLAVRWYPRYRAHRVAATWSEAEHRRFLQKEAEERVERMLRKRR